MISLAWRDARALSRAARGAGDRAGGLRMLRTDAWLLLFLFRLRKVVLRWRIPVVNRVLRLMQMVFGGVELGNDITLGEGVYFIHSLGTVVGGDSVVGDRVRFMGNNTVGTAKDNGYPVIGNDVEIGCGARILGPVRIGDGAMIGANAVVITDVPAGALAVGIPARVSPRHAATRRVSRTLTLEGIPA
jgi:serine O-acetyltransferase